MRGENPEAHGGNVDANVRQASPPKPRVAPQASRCGVAIHATGIRVSFHAGVELRQAALDRHPVVGSLLLSTRTHAKVHLRA
jgi:hypothetical protein